MERTAKKSNRREWSASLIVMWLMGIRTKILMKHYRRMLERMNEEKEREMEIFRQQCYAELVKEISMRNALVETKEMIASSEALVPSSSDASVIDAQLEPVSEETVEQEISEVDFDSAVDSDSTIESEVVSVVESASENLSVLRSQHALDKITKLIESNLDNPCLGVCFLAEQLNMSRSSLFLKVKALLDTTPNEMIRMVRLNKAVALLKDGNHRVNEVCYMVGFSSPSYFSKCFQKEFGVKPAEYIELL